MLWEQIASGQTLHKRQPWRRAAAAGFLSVLPASFMFPRLLEFDPQDPGACKRMTLLKSPDVRSTLHPQPGGDGIIMVFPKLPGDHRNSMTSRLINTIFVVRGTANQQTPHSETFCSLVGCRRRLLVLLAGDRHPLASQASMKSTSSKTPKSNVKRGTRQNQRLRKDAPKTRSAARRARNAAATAPEC
ncbi:uncharacterized protein BKA78DRAFT_188646 [Phyllosticta capitalensis]|uniref:uncharacterized protein n=1 Tax=Phyllosticta capitalensis TaxID=121624 RepID=UPI00312D5A79